MVCKYATSNPVPDDSDDLEVTGAGHDDGKREHVDADGLLDGRLVG